MSDDREHYETAGWAVSGVGLMGLAHALLIVTTGQPGGFIGPLEEAVIGGVLVLTGWFMREAHRQEE